MTAAQYALKMRARDKDLQKALAATTRGLAVSALKLSKENLTKIYAIPEDRYKNGKKKWTRTGHLRRSQIPPVITGPTSFIIRNTAAYAVPRHEYGRPETAEQKKTREEKGKEERSFNPLRVQHWQEDMFDIMNPICQEQWRETVRDVLEGKP